MFVESGDCAGMVERLDHPFIVSSKVAVPGCGYCYDHVHCQWVAHCEVEHNISDADPGSCVLRGVDLS